MEFRIDLLKNWQHIIQSMAQIKSLFKIVFQVRSVQASQIKQLIGSCDLLA